jgi:hypothetical protein
MRPVMFVFILGAKEAKTKTLATFSKGAYYHSSFTDL